MMLHSLVRKTKDSIIGMKSEIVIFASVSY